MQATEPRGPAESVRETAPLVSCFWCEALHPAEHPLSVCPACSATFWAMRSLGMSGPHPLSDDAIDEALSRTSPGNYALGFMEDGIFTVFYVGRSDTDLRQRLHEWVGCPSRERSYASPAKAPWGLHGGRELPVDSPALAPVGSAESGYTWFAYSYAASADAAFEKECRNYADFGGRCGLDNDAPPACTP